MVFALFNAGEPSTIETLRESVDEETPVGSVASLMALDPRFTRVTNSRWGLSEWDDTILTKGVYRLEEMFSQANNPIEIDDLPEWITAEDCSAPMFLIRSEEIRLRTACSETFELSPWQSYDRRFVYRLGEQCVAYSMFVEYASFKSNGITLPNAAAALLGMKPMETLEFHDSQGHSLLATYRDTSTTGAYLRSIHPLMMDYRMSAGDWLTIIMDRQTRTFTTHRVKSNAIYPALLKISLLTGISRLTQPNLAYALGCDENEVVEELERRGETTVVRELKRWARE